MKIDPVGAEFLQRERRTDRQTDVRKLKVESHNFVKKSEMILYDGGGHNIEWFQSNDAESIT